MVGWGIAYAPESPFWLKFRRTIWCRLFNWHSWEMDDETRDICGDCRMRKQYGPVK